MKLSIGAMLAITMILLVGACQPQSPAGDATAPVGPEALEGDTSSGGGGGGGMGGY
jgi:hypothetical protein